MSEYFELVHPYENTRVKLSKEGVFEQLLNAFADLMNKCMESCSGGGHLSTKIYPHDIDALVFEIFSNNIVKQIGKDAPCNLFEYLGNEEMYKECQKYIYNYERTEYHRRSCVEEFKYRPRGGYLIFKDGAY